MLKVQLTSLPKHLSIAKKLLNAYDGLIVIRFLSLCFTYWKILMSCKSAESCFWYSALLALGEDLVCFTATGIGVWSSVTKIPLDTRPNSPFLRVESIFSRSRGNNKSFGMVVL